MNRRMTILLRAASALGRLAIGAVMQPKRYDMTTSNWGA